jgi:hypothetical protein
VEDPVVMSSTYCNWQYRNLKGFGSMTDLQRENGFAKMSRINNRLSLQAKKLKNYSQTFFFRKVPILKITVL